MARVTELRLQRLDRAVMVRVAPVGPLRRFIDFLLQLCGGAALAGMKRGDILIKLGKFDIGSVEDLMFVLMQAKPGETVTAIVLRDGKPLTLEATFQEGRRH